MIICSVAIEASYGQMTKQGKIQPIKTNDKQTIKGISGPTNDDNNKSPIKDQKKSSHGLSHHIMEKALLQSEEQDVAMGKRKSEESPSESQFHCNVEIHEHGQPKLRAQLKAFTKDHPIHVALENVRLGTYFLQPPLFFELESPPQPSCKYQQN
eukprot:Gb_27693 [translate_table: standard]